MTQAQRAITLWIAVLTLLLAVGLPALQQHASYHAFADARSLFGVPRTPDMLSNLPFSVFGLWGLWQLQRTPALSKR